jgi:nickel-dependent lactate racemase
VRDENVTLLCAAGAHRPSTLEEKIAKLGKAVVERYRVVDHDAAAAIAIPGSRGKLDNLPYVNPLLIESDLIVATGVVEPHQYAGYSGGSKTVVIGCGGEATISLTHGPQYLDHPGVRLGQVEDNPFQAFVRAAAQQIGLRFVVNVVLDGDGQAVAVRAGDANAVHDDLVQVARGLYEVPVLHPFDVVIARVDPPKDVNLYQASRAPTYIGLSATPPIRPGGVMIIEARCPEGAGQGAGEQRFYSALSGATDLEAMLAGFRAHGCRAGEQRAFMLGQVLLKYEVIVVGSDCPEVVRTCKMVAVDSLDEAIDRARVKVGDSATVLHLPHPLHTLPIVKHDA